MSFRDRVSGVAKTEPPPPPPAEPAAFRSEAWLGRTIDDRYRIESLLGEGGMGAVFLAEHTKLQKKVGLKVILPQFAGDGELAERFAREAMASAKLEHPHVASALDYGALPEGGAYLVMQYVRGRSLRVAMDAGADWRFACEIGYQIADALTAAHAHRIVHRDLKPENVILEPRDDGTETVKVLDFGVARVAGEGPEGTPSKALTRIGSIIGTPGYMAPEQALGESVDTRADLYALGVVLWEIVAQRPLFPQDDLTAIVTAQLTSTPPRLSTLVPTVPAELDEIVARLLATKRDDRPEKAGEVRDTLRRLALGVTLEQKMLSGEIAVPSDITGSVRISAVQPPTGGQATGARPAVAAPSLVLPPMPEALRRGADALRGLDLGPLTRSLPEPLRGTMDVGPLRAVPRALVAIGCAAPLALGTLLFLLAIVVGGGGEATPEVAVAPVPAAVAPSQPRARAARRPDPPVPVVTAPSVPTEGPAIPDAIAADVEALLNASERADRDAAAERIQASAVPGTPPFVEAVVILQLTDRCPVRRDAVVRLGELMDPRALPALERLDRGRRGCGFMGTQDCHRCLRRELRSALAALRGASAE